MSALRTRSCSPDRGSRETDTATLPSGSPPGWDFRSQLEGITPNRSSLSGKREVGNAASKLRCQFLPLDDSDSVEQNS